MEPFLHLPIASLDHQQLMTLKELQRVEGSRDCQTQRSATIVRVYLLIPIIFSFRASWLHSQQSRLDLTL